MPDNPESHRALVLDGEPPNERSQTLTVASRPPEVVEWSPAPEHHVIIVSKRAEPEYPPALSTLEFESSPFHALLGFRVENDAAAREPQVELFWRREFLGLLFGTGRKCAIQLRIDAKPNGELATYLLATTSARSRRLAKSAGEELASAITSHSMGMGPSIRLVPVTDARNLKPLSNAAAKTQFCEISRNTRLLGPGITIPHEQPAVATTFAHASLTMLTEARRSGRAVGYRVVIESASDFADVLGELRDSTGRGDVPMPRGPAVRVQAFATAQGMVVPPAVISALCSDHADMRRVSTEGMPFVGLPVARPREREVVARALKDSHLVDWERVHATRSRPASTDLTMAARHLVTFDQACSLFAFPLVRVPGTERRGARAWELPLMATEGLTFGTSKDDTPVVIPRDDLRRHAWITGKSGTGKSTLMLNLISDAMRQDRGVIVLDPHGDLAEAALALVPPHRERNIIYFNPAEQDHPVSFNLIDADEENRALVTSNLLGVFQELYDPHQQGIVGPRFLHAVRNVVLTVMEAVPGATLLEVVRLLTEGSFVTSLLPKVQDVVVRAYWTEQIAQTADFHKSEVLDWLVSKFSIFTHDPRLRRVVGQGRSAFQLGDVMNNGKILICNLAEGLIGRSTSRFLGMTLVNQLLDAALARAAIPEADRRDCYVFVDEFQDFATPSFEPFLSGARKQRVALVLANQHTEQLPHRLRAAISGNVGTVVSFRVGVEDAPFIASAMQPSSVTGSELMSIPNFNALAITTVAGERTPPFLLRAPGEPALDMVHARTVREAALRRHGTPREIADERVAARYAPVVRERQR